jgi:hypothetical protein
MDEILFETELDPVLIDNQSPSPVEVSLTVDLMSVTENSGKEIKYTFTRKSTSDLIARQLATTNSTSVDTSSDLTVNFSISGSALLDTDYTLAGAVMSGNTYTVTIPTGQETATVTVTPIKDSEIESDEAVKFTLEEGNDYIIADDSQQFDFVRLIPSEAPLMDDNAVMSVITNDDPMLDAPWVKQFGGNGYGYEYLAVDDEYNTYVTGKFSQTVTLEGKTLTHNGGRVFDVFVAKLDKDGKVEWAEEFGGTDDEYVGDIALDDEGNTYITGTTEGSESGNIFVAKFDKDGTSGWTKNFGNNSNFEASGIEVDTEGNTYFTGDFSSQLTFPTTPDATTLNAGFQRDVFVAKLNSDGNVLWAEQFGQDAEFDYAEDIVVDKENNSYLFMTEGNEGGDNAVVVKLDKSDGSELWKKTFGDGSNSVVAEDIAIDSQDNIYITGEFEETVTFGNTSLQGGESGDAYVAKLDKSNGNVLWVKDFDSQNNDGDNVEVGGIAVDDMSNTYVTGYYTGESMSVGNFMLYSELSEGGEGSEGENAFITKFDSNGEVKWAQNLGGTNSETISDIAVKDDKIYVAGEFFQEATFGDKTFTAQSNERFLLKLEKEKPEISLKADSTTITEGDSKQITYTFTRTGDIKSELTVKFSVTGSATFNQDFTLANALSFDGTSGEVKFEAEKDTATVTLNIIDDSDAEEDETLGLELAMGSGYMVSTTEAKADITITKDENDVVIGSGNDDDDDDDNDDDVEFSLASEAKQTFKFKSKFTSGKSSIKFSFKSKSVAEFKEIAIVTVDDDEGNINGLSPDSEGYIEAALERSQSIFSLLGNTPQGFGDLDIEKVLEFSSETRFRFLSVKGGTLQGVKQGKINKSQVTVSSTDFLQVTESEKNSFDLDFEGVKIKMKFDAKAKKAVGSGLQSEIEVLDLRDLTGTQTVKCTVNREAAFDNIIGFYQVTSKEGGIDTDGDGNVDVSVGDANYSQIAVQNRITSIDLSVENQSSAEITGEFEAGAIIVPFLIVNGNTEAFDDIFFPFLGANSDGVDHVMMLGDNIFGFEDIKGGGDRDYNDITAKIEFINIST